MKPSKKKTAKKSIKAKSLREVPSKKKATFKKPGRAVKDKITKRVKSSGIINDEILRLSVQLKQKEHELEIEAALERVRARTMAMQRSEELIEAASIMFQQVQALGAPSWACGYNIWGADKKYTSTWNYGKDGIHTTFKVPTNQDVFLKFYEAEQRGEDFYVEAMGGNELEEHYQYLSTLPDLAGIVEAGKASGVAVPTFQIIHIAYFSCGYLTFITYEPVPEMHDVFRRFAKVFEQTYTRFLDLQKAEAQARESQIQLALERVRARTMAMQKSDELPDAANILFHQVQSLGMPAWSAGYCIWDEYKKAITLWMSSAGIIQQPFKVPTTEDPAFIHFYEAWQRGESFYVEEMGGEELVLHYKYMCKLPVVGEMLNKFVDEGNSLPAFQIFHLAFFPQGFLLFITYEPVPGAHDIFKRFAKVFEQTYTRFLDLQKAEAQAREARIETALERIRAKALGMHHSSELSEVLVLLFQQYDFLDIHPVSTLLNLFDIERSQFTHYTTGRKGKYAMTQQTVAIDASAAWRSAIEDWKQMKPQSISAVYYPPEVIPEIFELFKELRAGIPESERNRVEDFPDGMFQTIANCKFGSIGFLHSRKATEEEKEITARFAKEFERLYQRFLDLQKVEGQAREAHIQLSLERVRARAMGMHHSDELSEVLSLLFNQFDVLGIHPSHATISLIDLDTNSFVFRMTGKSGMRVMAEQVVSLNALDTWKETVDRLRASVTAEAYINEYSKEILPHLWDLVWQVVAAIPEDARPYPHDFPNGMFEAVGLYRLNPSGSFGTVSFCHHRKVTEEELAIVGRFATEFGRLYQRFLDLKKAEAQAREAKVEAALEKVRSRSMQMTSSNELRDVIQVVFAQLLHLDFKIDSASFSLNYKENDDFNLWTARPGHPYPTLFHIPYLDHPIFNEVKEAKNKGLDFFSDRYTKEEKDRFFIHFFKHAPHVPGDRQQFVLNSAGWARSQVLMETISLFIQNYQGVEFSTEENAILKRFGKVFEQTYTRFLDLQKAEAQAREAQIEAALERVRSRSLAMHKSEEILEVVRTMCGQFTQLGLEFNVINIGTDIRNPQHDFHLWIYSQDDGNIYPEQIHIPYIETTVLSKVREAIENGVDFFTITLNEKDKIQFYSHVFNHTAVGNYISAERRQLLLEKAVFTASFYILKHTLIILINYAGKPFSEEHNGILKRFGYVFEQSYTRFMDLQNAEAQAREANIEAALERVRSRTMAMQRSEELLDVASILFQQVKALGVPQWNCGFNIWDIGDKELTYYPGSPDGIIAPSPCKIPLTEHPVFKRFDESRKRREDLLIYEKEGEEQTGHYQYMLSLRPGVGDLLQSMLDSGFQFPTFQIDHVANFSYGNLIFITYEHFPEMHDAFKRFAKVFEQTYTRFLDLQKAEAQAREGQIQLALERVRARTMAMQKTDELREVVATLYEQLSQLNFDSNACNIIIIDKETNNQQYWVSGFKQTLFPESYKVPYFEHAYIDVQVQSWRQGQKYIVIEYSGETKKEFDKLFLSQTEFKNIPGEVKEIIKAFESQKFSTAFFTYGALQIIGSDSLSDENAEILQRFASVFEQTYTRFLDLQKAEAQAREALVETALERVRSRTMAMQHSSELAETSFLLVKQVIGLNIKTWGCAFNIFDADRPSSTEWFSNEQGYLSTYKIPREGVFLKYYNAAQKGKPLHVEEFLGDACMEHYKYLSTLPGLADEIRYYAENNVPLPTSQYDNVAFTKYGYVLFVTYEDVPDGHDIFIRFAKVFEQTYTRFLDLQKAEAQARESQIQLGLERVRARTMAMQHSEELSETAAVLFEQFHALGEAPERMAIEIVNESENVFDIWATQHGGSQLNLLLKLSLDEPHVMHKMYKAWKQQTKSITIDLQGDELEEYFQFLKKAGAPVSREIFNKRRVQNVATFSRGILTIITPEPRPAETIELLERFAAAFDGTYVRFLDLQKAEAQTREAQIEAALEKVRSRSLAMHKSDEMQEVVNEVFIRLKELEIGLDAANIFIHKKESNELETWTASSLSYVSRFMIPVESSIHFVSLRDAMESKREIFAGRYSREEKNVLLNKLFELTDYKHIAEERKQLLLDSPYFTFSAALIKNLGIQLNSYSRETFSENESEILKRFARVFEQAYTRFDDLQKAEAQAKEAQIEAALEKVRSRSLAMHKSDEVGFVVDELFLRMKDLEIGFDSVNILEFTDDAFQIWAAYQPGKFTVTKIPFSKTDIPYVRSATDARRNGQQLFCQQYLFEEKNLFLNYLFEETHFKNLPEERKEFLLQCPCYTVSIGFAKNTAIQLQSYSRAEFSQDENAILKRFVNVFEQCYTRFLDLKKAEAQTREAQIEASLERVRSKAMAMQKSEDLANAVAIVFEELEKLNLGMLRCGIGIMDRETRSSKLWTTTKSDNDTVVQVSGHESLDIHPLLSGIFDAWVKQEDFEYVLQGNDLNDYYKALADSDFTLPASQSLTSGAEEIKHYHFNAIFPAGGMFAFRETPFPEEAKNLLRRFADVFNLTYTRFNDLKQAEAQAREAQIEAALERVRSKTMAMHNSQDVGNTVATLFDELKKLGVKTNRCGILIFSDSNITEVWTARSSASGGANLIIGHLDVALHPMLTRARNAWKNKEASFIYEMVGDDLISYYQSISKQPGYLIQVDMNALPSREFHSDFYFPEGAVFAFTAEPIATDDVQIFKRLASVFGQTYRRYLDLQKAEAQAREATIEASLEKVRGKAMAMHNSTDLIATASLVFTELRKLGINSFRSGVGLLTKENRKIKLYSATSSDEGDSLAVVGWAVLDNHPVLSKTYDSWINNEDYFPILKGETLKSYYEKVVATFAVPVEQSQGYEQHGYFLPFSEGLFYGWSEKPYTEAEIKILNRFRAIVDLTFRRYMELQKSEANAVEAIRQASLDRVRAEIASMRTTNDLDRITPLIWKELNILNIPFVRCGVFIMDEHQRQMHTFLSTPDGKAIAAFHLPYDTPGNTREILSHWMNKQMYIRHWNETAFRELGELLVQQGAIPTIDIYMSTVPQGGIYLHCLPFLQGMLYVGNTTQLQESDIHLIQSVADAFSTAYSRYEDFNKLESAKAQIEKTLTDLKLTQTQLVQSEKMASLGELTAGIAHEIQNPLNFVNNFSEVSNELLEEMKDEIKKGNYDEVQSITDNIRQNLEKILHHGRRADGIVKGMLQHSRTSGNVKELTNINALADEYLRLAYHGLRAKDKSFNVTLKTDFQKDLESINVIPQDIGRVILNLITNAFYAVKQRKLDVPELEPTITLTTKKIGETVLISVKDNGSGIPKKILDKIFQPFFTTKPVGQGTGLGLSLSYDIVKAHGGELKVGTREGEGSEFEILLPVS